jgi:phage baseplate assembly protein W
MPNYTSEETVADRIPRYVDFDLNFKKSPLLENGDILLVTNADAIEQSIKTLLLTNRYERPFKPSMSGGSREFLMFNSIDGGQGSMRKNSHIKPTEKYLKENFYSSGYASYTHHAESAINRFEPRAAGSIVKMEVDKKGQVIANIQFKSSKTETQELSLIIQRDR